MSSNQNAEYRTGLISIIMPCFNAEKYLDEAIDSVMQQTYANLELIVVDDGSTDHSGEIINNMAKEYVGKIKTLWQEHKGPYSARNLALSQARGEYIAFLDADDYWHGDALQRLYAAIISARADLAYCGWQNIGKKESESHPYIPPKYEAQDMAVSFLKGCPWPIHAALMRRKLINDMGGVSERYPTAMDYDLWLRLTAFTKNIVLVPEALAFYRWHNATQISSTRWRQAIDAWRVRKDFALSNPELLSHLSNEEIHKLINDPVLSDGYKSYWKRDLISACHLFRKALFIGLWKIKDLKYLLPSLLPEKVYCFLIKLADNKSGN